MRDPSLLAWHPLVPSPRLSSLLLVETTAGMGTKFLLSAPLLLGPPITILNPLTAPGGSDDTSPLRLCAPLTLSPGPPRNSLWHPLALTFPPIVGPPLANLEDAASATPPFTRRLTPLSCTVSVLILPKMCAPLSETRFGIDLPLDRMGEPLPLSARSGAAFLKSGPLGRILEEVTPILVVPPELLLPLKVPPLLLTPVVPTPSLLAPLSWSLFDKTLLKTVGLTEKSLLDPPLGLPPDARKIGAPLPPLLVDLHPPLVRLARLPGPRVPLARIPLDLDSFLLVKRVLTLVSD